MFISEYKVMLLIRKKMSSVYFSLNCVIFPQRAVSYSQKMLIYDALDGRFLSIKLRPKQPNCCVCGDNPSINKLLDYELFCGASATDKVGI